MLPSAPIMLGQYRPYDSLLHRIDPRAKLLPIVVTLVLAVLTDSLLFYIGVLGLLIVSLLLSGVPIPKLLQSLQPVLWLVGVTALYHLLFAERHTDTVFSWWIVRVTEGGVVSAAFYSLRLLIFVGTAILITLTTSPADLAEIFARLIRPLRVIKVPTEDIALILFIAIRFIPVLYEEFYAIRNAQMIRGVDFGGSLIRRLRKTTALLIPVFVSALNRADDLALAIEARGYRGDVKRTTHSRLRIGQAEIGFMLVSTTLVVAFYFLTLSHART